MDGLEAKIHVAQFKYDFSVDGGAQGAIVLNTGLIPKGAQILGALILNPSTDLAGATATVSLGINAAGDLHAADAIADINAGPLWADQVTFGETAPLVLAAAKGLTVTIATADLTAGVFQVRVLWMHG